ncbi:MAG: penicillin-binding protein 2, partial [Myxococcales bacterium]|nr:penicillin-binding protein 2 [Myxococcales bacterium]
MSAPVTTPKPVDPARRRRWMKVRIGLLGVLVLAGAGMVTRRAYELQVERAPALREMAEEQYLRSVRLAPKRGAILDRHGAELAVSVDVDSVWASPREIQREGGDPSQIVARLAELLEIDRERVERRLRSDRFFVWVKRHVTPETAARVREAALPGVHIEREARRFYPNRELAAHVLGFANIDGVGIEGLELSLEERLRGSRRTVPAIRDRRGRIVFSETLLDDSAGQGADVTLTIDRTIQRVAERELALAVQTFEAKAGSVVVMDPQSGEILAIADYPTFDPNHPGAAPPSHRRNRAVTDRFEPGSTVKPFTVAAALNAGRVRPEQRIDCENGAMRVDEYVIHDTTPHEELTPAQILAYSSNIGTAKIGNTLGREGLYRAFRAFGFGESSGLPLPGEASGNLRHFRRWYEMDAATISFGQGVSVTSVQLANAMSVIANGGVLVRPTLVRRVTGPSGETIEETRPEVRRRVVSERTARLVADMLTAVTGPGGTATEAAIDGFLVAGKTGTAQKADYVGGGYARDQWVSSFVGFVPADRPRLVISVVIDEPIIAYYGGVVA